MTEHWTKIASSCWRMLLQGVLAQGRAVEVARAQEWLRCL
jgi:hypothetical protein